MHIPSELMQNVFGSAEGPFCIHDPFVPEELAQETEEHLGIGQAFEWAVETQFAFAEERGMATIRRKMGHILG